MSGPAKETIEAFKNMIKTKQPKKFGLTKAPSLKESLKSYVLNEKSSNTILTVKKKICVCRKKHSITEKYYLQILGV